MFTKLQRYSALTALYKTVRTTAKLRLPYIGNMYENLRQAIKTHLREIYPTGGGGQEFYKTFPS